jgi:REP element-mobilizing transposase RayT
LGGYDYTSPGAYFVTVCTRNRECVFGEIAGGAMVANDAGRLVAEEWHRTFTVRNNISMDEYVVMPNHFHGIVVLHDSVHR